MDGWIIIKTIYSHLLWIQSLRKVLELGLEGIRRWAAASLSWKHPGEVVLTSDKDASSRPPFWGIWGMFKPGGRSRAIINPIWPGNASGSPISVAEVRDVSKTLFCLLPLPTCRWCVAWMKPNSKQECFLNVGYITRRQCLRKGGPFKTKGGRWLDGPSVWLKSDWRFSRWICNILDLKCQHQSCPAWLHVRRCDCWCNFFYRPMAHWKVFSPISNNLTLYRRLQHTHIQNLSAVHGGTDGFWYVVATCVHNSSNLTAVLQ